jgi:hypothetical protein
LTQRNNAAGPGEVEYEISKSHIIDPDHEYIDLTDAQIDEAKAFTVSLAADDKKAGIKRPNPLSIKKYRSTENALLLIYFLDPFPGKSTMPLAECPIIGLAISFPEIDKDKKIQYAVNNQFLKQFDYPDEVEDMEEEEEWEEESNDEKSLILGGIVAHLRDERKINVNLAFRIIPGVAGIYLNASTDQLTQDEPNVILQDTSAGLISGYVTVPFIRQRDLDRYRIEKSKLTVINPSFPTRANSIIATKKGENFFFALAEKPSQVDQNCVEIQIDRLPAGYILALLNSSVFEFWAKEEKVATVEEAIGEFPLKNSEQSAQIAAIVEATSILLQAGEKRESKVAAFYFLSLLDSAVFEIYFQEEFQQLNISILKHLPDTDTISKDADELKKMYKKINKPENPIHKAIRAALSVGRIRAIYDFLK